MELYHITRDLDSIGPKLREAFEDVPFMPWLNKSHVLKRQDHGDWSQPPFELDENKIRQNVERFFFDEEGRALGPYAYPDLEPPITEATDVKELDIFRHLSFLIKTIRGMSRIKLGLYSTLHRPFYWQTPGVPFHFWHASIDDYYDWIGMSLYNRSKMSTPREKIADDLDRVKSYIDFYEDGRRHGKEVMAFISGAFKDGTNQPIPMEHFEVYIKGVIRLIKEPLVFVWFGSEYDQDYANKVNFIKTLL